MVETLLDRTVNKEISNKNTFENFVSDIEIKDNKIRFWYLKNGNKIMTTFTTLDNLTKSDVNKLLNNFKEKNNAYISEDVYEKLQSLKQALVSISEEGKFKVLYNNEY